MSAQTLRHTTIEPDFVDRDFRRAQQQQHQQKRQKTASSPQGDSSSEWFKKNQTMIMAAAVICVVIICIILYLMFSKKPPASVQGPAPPQTGGQPPIRPQLPMGAPQNQSPVQPQNNPQENHRSEPVPDNVTPHDEAVNNIDDDEINRFMNADEEEEEEESSSSSEDLDE